MRIVSFLMIALLAACGADKQTPETVDAKPKQQAESAEPPITASSAPQLEPLWVAEGFSSPEGVVENPTGDLFISNVAGEGTGKDGEGWISILSKDGSVTTPKFITGLDAPKGSMPPKAWPCWVARSM